MKSGRTANVLHMFALAGLLLLLQALSFVIAFEVALHFMTSCQESGTLGWQCSGTVSPDPWELGAVIIAPPLLAKLLLLKRGISWKRILITHSVVFLALVCAELVNISVNHCGCGGA